jgi:hypothetical protein
MPEPRARFRFETDKKVEVDTKRVLIQVSSNQLANSAAFGDQAYKSTLSGLSFLVRLHISENRFLERKVFEHDGEAIAAQAEREALITEMQSLTARLQGIRQRSLDALVAFEEANAPFFSLRESRVKLLHHKLDRHKLEDNEGVEVAGPEPVAPTVVKEPAPAPAALPVSGGLKLDPELLKRAQAELKAVADAKSGVEEA